MEAYNYFTKQRRQEWLAADIKKHTAQAALLCFTLTKLQKNQVPLKDLLKLGTKQGYTPAVTRKALSSLIDADLIEYIHSDPFIYVRLNENGLQFVEGLKL